MRPGFFRVNRRRAVRAVAGLVAAFVFTGNVLAAAGLCAMKTPETHPASRASAQPVAATPCAGHVADELKGGTPAASHHCPTDDPSAQSRGVDVPAAQAMPALIDAAFHWTGDSLQAAPVATSDQRSEPQPLYARLQRLRL